MRRRYFIKKPFQIKFFLAFLALLLLQALLIVGLFLYFSGQTLTTGYSGSRFVITKTSSFFLANIVLISTAVGASIVFLAILVFIILSHRIAGPLYRFEKSLADMSKGNLSKRIALRRTDQLRDLQSALNECAEALDGRLRGVKEELKKAHEAMSAPGGERAAGEAIERARQKIAFFKTS